MNPTNHTTEDHLGPNSPELCFCTQVALPHDARQCPTPIDTDEHDEYIHMVDSFIAINSGAHTPPDDIMIHRIPTPALRALSDSPWCFTSSSQSMEQDTPWIAEFLEEQSRRLGQPRRRPIATFPTLARHEHWDPAMDRPNSPAASMLVECGNEDSPTSSIRPSTRSSSSVSLSVLGASMDDLVGVGGAFSGSELFVRRPLPLVESDASRLSPRWEARRRSVWAAVRDATESPHEDH